MSTRYNTGNPIESTDVRDMSDNAKNFDLFSSSSELSFDDRLGIERKTIHGMNSEFDAQILNMGFTRVGTFLSGATLTNHRQTLLWDIADGGDGQEYGWSGAFPKVVPAASTPASTGGISVGAWISRFDPELRIQVRESIRRSYAEAGYNLVAGSFEAGGTLVNANDVLLYEANGKAYSFSGALPHTVRANSAPGNEPGMWIDRSLSPNSFTQEGVGAVLRSAQDKMREKVSVKDFGAKGDGVSDDTDAISAALKSSSHVVFPPGTYRTRLPLHVTTQQTVEGDGQVEIIKFTDDVLSDVPPALAPERSGVVDYFDKNALLVVSHVDNAHSLWVRIRDITFRYSGPTAVDYEFWCPRSQFSSYERLKFYGKAVNGFRTMDTYASTFNDVYLSSNFNGDGSVGFAFDDGGKSTGTSITANGVHVWGWAKGFVLDTLQYSTFTNCGGEQVGFSERANTPSDYPIVFHITDSVVTLNAPSTEHLYGGFLRAGTRNTEFFCSVVVNTPQVNTAIFGTKTDVGAKLFDALGLATVSITGGFAVTAAEGYFLKFGGAKDDSRMDINNMDHRFVINDFLNDSEAYSGVHTVKWYEPYFSRMYTLASPVSSSNTTLKFTTSIDVARITKPDKSGFRIKRGGIYTVDAHITIKAPGRGAGVVGLFRNGSEVDRAYVFTDASLHTISLHYRNRLNPGDVIELKSIELYTSSVDGFGGYENSMQISLVS